MAALSAGRTGWYIIRAMGALQFCIMAYSVRPARIVNGGGYSPNHYSVLFLFKRASTLFNAGLSPASTIAFVWHRERASSVPRCRRRRCRRPVANIPPICANERARGGERTRVIISTRPEQPERQFDSISAIHAPSVFDSKRPSAPPTNSPPPSSFFTSTTIDASTPSDRSSSSTSTTTASRQVRFPAELARSLVCSFFPSLSLCASLDAPSPTST